MAAVNGLITHGIGPATTIGILVLHGLSPSGQADVTPTPIVGQGSFFTHTGQGSNSTITGDGSNFTHSGGGRV